MKQQASACFDKYSIVYLYPANIRAIDRSEQILNFLDRSVYLIDKANVIPEMDGRPQGSSLISVKHTAQHVFSATINGDKDDCLNNITVAWHWGWKSDFGTLVIQQRSKDATQDSKVAAWALGDSILCHTNLSLYSLSATTKRGRSLQSW